MVNISTKNIAHSSKWSVIAALIDKFAVLIVYITLARFISKEDFGYIALILLIIDFSNYIIGMGIRERLVTLAEWNRPTVNTAFWLLIGFSIGICIFIWIITLTLLGSVNNKEVITFIQAISFVPLIHSINIVQLAKLQREFRFRALALRSLITTTLSMIIAVTLAWNNYGVWSFIAYKYSYVMINTVILWAVSKYKPAMEFSLRTAKQFIMYGSPIVATGIILLSNRKLMELIVAPFLGVKSLGELDIGKKLPDTIYQVFIVPLNAVGLSYYSKVNSKQKAYCDYVGVISILILPLMLTLGFFSDQIIFIVFGEDKVEVSSDILKITCLGVFAAIYNWSIQSFLISMARQKLNLYLTIGELIFVLASCLLFIEKGIITFVFAYIISTSLFLIVKLLLIRRFVGLDLNYLIVSQIRPVVGVIVLGVVYYGLDKLLLPLAWFENREINALFNLVVVGGAGFLIYMLVLAMMYKTYVLQWLKHIRGGIE